MEALGNYILCIAIASIVLGILKSLLDQKSAASALLRLTGGIFLAFTVISPIADIELDKLFDIPATISAEGSTVAALGHDIAGDKMKDIIKEECEAYILDKAASYQAVLEAEVVLTDDEPPVPVSVQLSGAISPFAKTALQQWLQENLGITKENQSWIG